MGGGGGGGGFIPDTESLNGGTRYEKQILLLSQLQARTFQYDHVLRPDCSQLDVYAMAARPLVKGRRGCCC